MYDFATDLADRLSALPRVDYADLPATRAALRAAVAHHRPYQPSRPVEVGDRLVPGPPGAPPVAVRVYRPDADRPQPALIYLHWGGFVTGDLETVHQTCLRLADRIDAVVVNVGYRLAPEHPFPAGLEDCYAALEWLAKEGAGLGVDTGRIAVGGESAGGGLAAALALAVRDRGGPALRLQCLLFPALDDRLETVSARAFTDTPMWDRHNAQVSWRYYLGDAAGGDAVDPLAAPARADDLGGLPPAYVLACEYDPLRDEALTYAHRLIQAGVKSRIGYHPGTFHACIALGDTATAQQILTEQESWLRDGLHSRPAPHPRPGGVPGGKA
ncbi:alpha/beta hydrolase [Micromonospora sp. NPDC049101]|uniref:alpha/beta hydrolase n=1 Tax=Micromonospora sp. NPDC049101 TaxID=3155032 RepID=UPI0033C83740